MEVANIGFRKHMMGPYIYVAHGKMLSCILTICFHNGKTVGANSLCKSHILISSLHIWYICVCVCLIYTRIQRYIRSWNPIEPLNSNLQTKEQEVISHQLWHVEVVPWPQRGSVENWVTYVVCVRHVLKPNGHNIVFTLILYIIYVSICFCKSSYVDSEWNI